MASSRHVGIGDWMVVVGWECMSTTLPGKLTCSKRGQLLASTAPSRPDVSRYQPCAAPLDHCTLRLPASRHCLSKEPTLPRALAPQTSNHHQPHVLTITLTTTHPIGSLSLLLPGVAIQLLTTRVLAWSSPGCGSPGHSLRSSPGLSPLVPPVHLTLQSAALDL